MRITIALLFCVLVWSCKKGAWDGPDQPMQFEIVGLPDSVSMEQRDTLGIPFSVNLISGYEELVTLQISGLPSKLGAGFSTSIATPAFQSVLRLVSSYADTGWSTITVTATDSRKTVSASFKVHIGPNPENPAAILNGNYTESGPCSQTGNLNHTVKVEEMLPEFNKIRFIGLWNGHESSILEADIDPVTQTVSIPEQTVNSALISGSGYYSGSQIFLEYKSVISFAEDSCNVVLTKF